MADVKELYRLYLLGKVPLEDVAAAAIEVARRWGVQLSEDQPESPDEKHGRGSKPS